MLLTRRSGEDEDADGKRTEESGEGGAEEEDKRFNVTYKDLMSKIVCDMDKLECMVHRCEDCPGFEALKTYLVQLFEKHEFDSDDAGFSKIGGIPQCRYN